MRKVIRRQVIVVLLGAMAFAAAGCGSNVNSRPGPGLTASAITFGSHQPLTGPAAPGYRKIGAASQAFFDYVNAHGGVFGRTIKLITMNDAYNPTQALSAVNQLVLYDNVFGIFQGVGTATHALAAPFLNSERVPDLFVASGCPCWADGVTQPYTYGWQPSGKIEGKLLGWYIQRHFRGQKVGILYQNDEAGKAAVAGLQDEVTNVVARQPYATGTTTLLAQIKAIKRAGAKVLVDFTLPTYTAIGQLTAMKLNYRPQLVAWSGGMDPTTVSGLLHAFSEGTIQGDSLIQGAITDAYLPSAADTTNRWVQLFKRIAAQYDPGTQFDQNVEYGMASAYTVVQALRATGRYLGRQALIDAINTRGSNWTGPGLVPLRYSTTRHGGYTGAQLGRVEAGKLVLFGRPMVTTKRARSPVKPYTGAQAVPPAGGIPK